MDKRKIDLNIKKGLADVERFTRRYLTETLTVVAILAAVISAWSYLFMGSLVWSILFLAAGSIVGIFFPVQIDRIIKKIYSFSGETKTSQILSEAIKILIALFLPFIYFCFLGLLAGTAYHYYTRHAQSGGQKGNKVA